MHAFACDASSSIPFSSARNFTDDVVAVAQQLVPLTLALWSRVAALMLPTPAKFHYLFNMRDLSKVILLSFEVHVRGSRALS